MRTALAAAAAALLAACGPKAAPPTDHPPPAAVTCENVVQPPIALLDGMVEDLGTLAVGATAHFNVPAGTAAFFLVAQALGTTGDGTATWGGISGVPNVVVPTNVRSPSNPLYYSDTAALPTTTIAGIVYDDFTGALAEPGLDAAVGVFAFPNTAGALQALASAVPPGSVEAGQWSFTVNDWDYECLSYAHSNPSCVGGSTAGRYRIYAVYRPTPAGTATLNVEVYLATASSSVLPDPGAAAASPSVLRWKQSLAFYLANAGITLGAVTFHAVPDAAKSQYAPNGAVDVASSGPCSDLAQLFTSGAVASRAVNVFLADELVAPSIGSGFVIAGVDGSIPGPSGFPGTINSGAIVGLENFGYERVAGVSCSAGGPPSIADCGADRTAYVTAHEIGHWLGLYHVTERDGTFFDPLSDTSVCPCHVCAAVADQGSCADAHPSVSASAATLVTADRCVTGAGCGGGDNLMFWLLSDAWSTGALSPQQAQVMRLNPAVQ